MNELLRRWERGWGLCRGLDSPIDRGSALEVVLGLPDRDRELFALDDGAPVVQRLANEVATAAKPTWLTVTTQQPDATTRLLEYAGLNLFAEWKLLMSISLRDHPSATALTEYGLESSSDGPLEYARVLDADGKLAARGMMAIVGADAVMHDIQTDPKHRRRGLGSVVMAMLSRRALQRGAVTGLLMATTDGGHLYGKLGWSTEATMLTATTPGTPARGRRRPSSGSGTTSSRTAECGCGCRPGTGCRIDERRSA